MERPKNPIEAVTHFDPYPYYEELRAARPLYYDQELDFWVATGGREIEEILADENCRVRPASEPIPAWIIGLQSGKIFNGWARMKDGAEHAALKRSISQAISLVAPEKVAERSRVWARRLVRELDAATHLNQYLFQLPVSVMGDLLGLVNGEITEAAAWIGDFVRGIAPSADVEGRGSGDQAAGRLCELFDGLQDKQEQSPSRGLFSALTQTIAGTGDQRRAAVTANGIGLLSQTYDATAGLIGNTLVALAEQEDARALIDRDESLLASAISETLRYDAPVQNTRRFLAADSVIAGQRLRKGQGILLIPAAANRDRVYNSEPDRFDLFRKEPRCFTFGLGRHACPGTAFAITIAAAGVSELRRSGYKFEATQSPRRYHPSINARIPIF